MSMDTLVMYLSLLQDIFPYTVVVLTTEYDYDIIFGHLLSNASVTHWRSVKTITKRLQNDVEIYIIISHRFYRFLIVLRPFFIVLGSLKFVTRSLTMCDELQRA